MSNTLLHDSVDFDEILDLMDKADEKTGPIPQEILDFQARASAIVTGNMIGGGVGVMLLPLITQNIFLSLFFAWVFFRAQNTLSAQLRHAFETRHRETLTQYHRIMSENSSSLISDGITQVFIQADKSNYTDAEVQESIESLKDFFTKHGWGDQFILACQKNPYILARLR